MTKSELRYKVGEEVVMNRYTYIQIPIGTKGVVVGRETITDRPVVLFEGVRESRAFSESELKRGHISEAMFKKGDCIFLKNEQALEHLIIIEPYSDLEAVVEEVIPHDQLPIVHYHVSLREPPEPIRLAYILGKDLSATK